MCFFVVARSDSRFLLQPQDAYGLEKLASEELAMHYDKDFALECRIARFHNIYGPYGTWKGGREKAPAAFCRKVSLKSSGMGLLPALLLAFSGLLPTPCFRLLC